MSIPMPQWLKTFYSRFPLYTYPEQLSLHCAGLSEDHESDEEPVDISPNATLCILPPAHPETSLLSADVECLKWQAYLALRGVPGGMRVRWDLSPDGALGEALPNLYLPPPKLSSTRKGNNQLQRGELLEASRIPSWLDGEIEKHPVGSLEGYLNEQARDESRAWTTLLEGDVHGALLLTKPAPSLSEMLATFDVPTKAAFYLPSVPLTGLSSPIPPFGTRVDKKAILQRYNEAVTALSDRLGGDDWLLGSQKPTALDALAFAYVHTALQSSSDSIKQPVDKLANLVAWEGKVAKIVQNAMRKH